MAQSDMLKRYLDAGMAFTQMTRDRAEAIVKELVKAGEIQREHAQERAEELVERSRRNTEDLLGIVRREFGEQLESLRRDVARLETRLRGGGPEARPGGGTSTPSTASSAPSTPARAATTTSKTASRKAPAVGVKKATKAAAAKAPARKATKKA